MVAWPNTRVAIVGLGIAFIALWLRTYRLDGTLMYSDQSASWRVANSESLSQLIERCSGDTHPPLYFLLLRFWSQFFGSSVIALRSLSVVIGVATIAAVYQMVRESLRWKGESDGSSQVGGTFAAVLTAIHYLDVGSSRNVRMYVLCVFLSATSSWLLIRALRTETNVAMRWGAYGLSLVALCYTHNFAMLTLAAHLTFVVCGVIAGAVGTAMAVTMRQFGHFLAAVGVSIALYTPWLPILFQQSHRVQTDFWIPPPTIVSISEVVVAWATGIGYWDGAFYGTVVGVARNVVVWMAIAVLLFVEGTVVWAVVRGNRAAIFFSFCAFVPWGCAIVLSNLLQRPITLPRYMSFAHAGMLGLMGTAFVSVRSGSLRFAFAATVVIPCIYGTYLHVRVFPVGPPAIDSAVSYLEKHYQPDDIVLTGDPMQLLELRYHSEQVELHLSELYCPVELPKNNGHVNHFSIIQPNERLREGLNPPPSVTRIWVAGADRTISLGNWSSALANWEQIESLEFAASDDWEDPVYQLSLYVRPTIHNTSDTFSQ